MRELVPQIRPDYWVSIEERLYIHEPPAVDRGLSFARADLAVGSISNSATSVQTLNAPAYGTISTTMEIEKQRYLEIRSRDGEEIVTVIELLSPSNKRPGADREQYVNKRNEILSSPTHLVEIDLLRDGPRMPVTGFGDCDYCAVVSDVASRPRVGIWAWSLREPLPILPIPLRGASQAKIDLKTVIDRVYDEGGYSERIYRFPVSPPLSEVDAEWANALISTS